MLPLLLPLPLPLPLQPLLPLLLQVHTLTAGGTGAGVGTPSAGNSENRGGGWVSSGSPFFHSSSSVGLRS